MKKHKKSKATKALIQLNGGAWKVAAADFFCSMMALFMVMWILSQDDEMLAQTAHYFNNPFVAMGAERIKTNNPIDLGGSTSLSMTDKSTITGAEKKDFVEKLAEQFMKHLNIDASDDDSPFTVNTSSDGMILTIFNRTQKPLFEPNTASFTSWGNLVMRNISWLVDRYDLKVRIESHTLPDFKKNEEYESSWDISTAQANEVRKAMVYYALDPQKLSRVTAFADTRPLADLPLDSTDHQRIVISLEPSY